MRIVVSSVTCDRCLTQRDFDTDEEELSEGWLIVHHRDRQLDFCDPVCASEFDYEEEV